MSKQVKIERKESRNWVEVISFDSTVSDELPHMAAFYYIYEHTGDLIIDSRFTDNKGKRVIFYKTKKSDKGFDFRVTIS